MKDRDYGGTMRLGSYPCVLKKGSMARKLYGREMIMERHRHRYEANPAYRCELEEKGLMVSGLSPDGKLAEIVEIKDHPFFMATQFHPELKTRPFRPHPLFLGFIKAAVKRSKK
jgi:CTP synthase